MATDGKRRKKKKAPAAKKTAGPRKPKSQLPRGLNQNTRELLIRLEEGRQ